MKIKRKPKNDIILSNEKEIIDYINNKIDNIKDFNILSNKQDILNIFLNDIYESKIVKILKSHFYMISRFNENYWLSRGWTKNESKEKISELQTKFSNISKEKMEKLKEDNYLEWAKTRVNNKEYYINKGYSEFESIEIIRKRQSTFSLEICINKYGLEKGTEIFNKRQSKWINSLKDFTGTMNKDSSSLIHFDFDIDSFINKNITNNKDFYLTIINDKLNYDECIKLCEKTFDILSLKDIDFLFKSKLIQYLYKKKYDELKKYYIEKYRKFNVIRNIGTIRWFNNHICRSNGEYQIARYLVNNNINYIYEKKYTDSKSISDFYLIDSDYYIEYMGLLKSDYMRIHNNKIIDCYIDRMNKKKKFCEENDIKCFFSSSVNEILKFIENENK